MIKTKVAINTWATGFGDFYFNFLSMYCQEIKTIVAINIWATRFGDFYFNFTLIYGQEI